MRRRDAQAPLAALPARELVFRPEEWREPGDDDYRPDVDEAFAARFWVRVLASRRFHEARQALYAKHGRRPVSAEARRRCEALADMQHQVHRSWCPRCMTTARADAW